VERALLPAAFLTLTLLPLLPATSKERYCPVPVTLNVCTAGVAESATVTAAARVPTALGVKVTMNVHCAFEASVAPHGVVPPGTAGNPQMPVIVGLNEVLRLLVRETV